MCIRQQRQYILPLRNWGNDPVAFAPFSHKMYGPPGPPIIFPIAEKTFPSTWNPPNITKIESKVGYSSHWICFSTFAIGRSYVTSKLSSWWRRFEHVLKTSFVFVFRRRLQDVLIKTNMFALALRLQKTSWSRPIYSSWPYVFKTSSRRFQDVLKTSSRRPAKMSSRRLQDVLKASSRHLQDVLKTYYQVKVFLVTQFQDIFEKYSKRFWDVLPRWLSTGGLPRSHFREIYDHCAKFPSLIKISEVLIFPFTTPFSGYTLQRPI